MTATVTHSSSFVSPTYEILLNFVPPSNDVGDIKLVSVILSGLRGDKSSQSFYFPTPYVFKSTISRTTMPATTTMATTTPMPTQQPNTPAATPPPPRCDDTVGDICFKSISSLLAMHSRKDAIDACRGWHPQATLPKPTSMVCVCFVRTVIVSFLVISSQALNDAAFRVCNTSWLALERPMVDSTDWRWYDDLAPIGSFINFASTEPNNYKFSSGATEDCTSFAQNGRGKWNDRPCVFEKDNPGHPRCVTCELRLVMICFEPSCLIQCILPTPS